jgi:uncharacterized damage-inducible protein DinB
MNKELQYIITTLQNTLDGEPWYGRPVIQLLQEADPAVVYEKPANNPHSPADLLYHMITWAEFTLMRLQGDKEKDDAWFDKIDWRPIDPAVHTWKEGIEQFRHLNQQIIALLQTKDDSLLQEKVDFREYNVRFLLHGYIQHNIYHAGQIVYALKSLVKAK